MLRMNDKFTPDLKEIAIKTCKGIDNYYEELKNLISDIQFFNMYMKRESKSSFQFYVSVRKNGSFGAFEALRKDWGQWCDDADTLETVFVEFLCLKMLIDHLYEGNVLSHDEVVLLINYFEQYKDFNVSDYVPDFIECSSGCSAVLSKLEKLRGKMLKK